MALLLLASLSTLAAGCMRSYLVPYDGLVEADHDVAAGADPNRIAVRAVASPARPEEPATCLRRSHLPRVPPRTSDLLEVRAADSHAERVGGTIMTSMGASLYLGLITHVVYSAAAARACEARPDCLNEDWSLMITAPVLGILGSSMLAPGITLAARGFGRPSDAYPRGSVDRCVEPPAPPATPQP